MLPNLKKAVRLNANLTISNRVVDHCRALYRNRVSSWQSHCYVVLFLFDYDVISNVNNCDSECNIPRGSETFTRNIHIDLRVLLAFFV